VVKIHLKKTIAHDVVNYGDIVKNCCKMALSKYLRPKTKVLSTTLLLPLPTKARQGKDIVFRFIIEYNRLRDFGP